MGDQNQIFAAAPNSPTMFFDEVALTDNPKARDSANDKVIENPEAEDFFQRLPSTFRWPKPSADAIAAAAESILRLSGSAAIAQDMVAAGESAPEVANACAGCGAPSSAGSRFCGWCGYPIDAGASAAVLEAAPGSPASAAARAVHPASASGQHHFHHHYHHLVPAQGVPTGTAAASSASTEVRGRAPGSVGPAPGGRAEIAARQVVQDWAQACNTRHIDDLLELYAADATLIRSSLPPVRSLPAIREFLLSMLEAGLGDVEMESLRLEVMGEIAMDLGRCKMLVPVAMGKRREERGKYLVVLVRQPTGAWKILADCWANDLPVSVAPPTDPQKSK